MLGRTRLASLFLTLVVSAAATAQPTSSETLRLQEILGRLRSPAASAAIPSGHAAVLEALLDHKVYPGSCATPLVLALARGRNDLPDASQRLIEGLGPGGARPDHQVFISSAVPSPGSFRIRYTISPDQAGAVHADDGDLDGVPDEVRRILSLLQEARLSVLEAFDRSGTPIGGPEAAEAVHDVEVTDLPEKIAGWIWPEPRGPVLLLDRDLVLSQEGPHLLRHQIAHLIQIGLTPEESPWWYEAHAIWAEDPTGVRAGLRAAAVSAYLAVSEEGLEPDAIAAWEGAFLWPHFLAAGGAQEAVLGAAWREMASVPGNNTIAAFEAAVSRIRGTTLAEDVRAFRVWNLFLGDFDDGGHYPFGADLDSPIREHVRAYPALVAGSGPLAPLGSAAAQLLASPSPGGWILDFAGEPGPDWDISIVTISARLDAGPRLARISVEDARGTAAIPWRDLAAVVVLVQNLGGERREPARFSFTARYDPLVPFDLMSFTAEPDDAGVAIRWTTEKEIDLVGWRIYRSRDPLTGFAPINTLMIPATGGSDGASYLFLDGGPRPGRKYYYVLEGITRHGFTEITHPSAARMPSPPDGSR